jgi:hypothetical protein
MCKQNGFSVCIRRVFVFIGFILLQVITIIVYFGILTTKTIQISQKVMKMVLCVVSENSFFKNEDGAYI